MPLTRYGLAVAESADQEADLLLPPMLPPDEAEAFAQAEETVRAGMKVFFELGDALADIRDKRWYRAKGYQTFECYTENRWGLSRSHAYRLISAAEIVSHLRDLSPCGDILIPANEAQVRPLTRLDAADQPMAWQTATQAAASEGKPVAARHVAAAVAQVKATKPTDGGRYVCESCGDMFARWEASCPSCHEWNALVETGANGSPAPVLDLPTEPVFVWRDLSRLVYNYRDAKGDRTVFAEIEPVTSSGGSQIYTVAIGGVRQATAPTKAAAMNHAEACIRSVAGLPPATRTTPTGGTTP